MFKATKIYSTSKRSFKMGEFLIFYQYLTSKRSKAVNKGEIPSFLSEKWLDSYENSRRFVRILILGIPVSKTGQGWPLLGGLYIRHPLPDQKFGGAPITCR